jgi:hypothetical protein
MSTTLFPNDILFTQCMLKSEGLYTGALNGIWGALTEKSANAFDQQCAASVDSGDRQDLSFGQYAQALAKY